MTPTLARAWDSAGIVATPQQSDPYTVRAAWADEGSPVRQRRRAILRDYMRRRMGPAAWAAVLMVRVVMASGELLGFLPQPNLLGLKQQSEVKA